MMKNDGHIDDIDVKKANIRHHDIEAEFFERAHPEGSSIYEKSKVLESISFIVENSGTTDLCVDVGCGTGFIPGFELPIYRAVVAIDISSRMIDATLRRLNSDSLNLMICDADFLPFKNEMADMVSVSSVLHHLPKPFNTMTEMCRILKKRGFLYVTREPSYYRLRRFFHFFDLIIVQSLSKVIRDLLNFKSEFTEPKVKIQGLDYAKVDVHYPNGLRVEELTGFLKYRHMKVITAYSYHWIYPDSNKSLLNRLVSNSNFVVEKMPLSDRLGRYVSIIAQKI